MLGAECLPAFPLLLKGAEYPDGRDAPGVVAGGQLDVLLWISGGKRRLEVEQKRPSFSPR